jgi:hypothetical protein
MKTIFAVLSVVAFSLFWYASVQNEKAMAECQKTHSYDTCFYSLNH